MVENGDSTNSTNSQSPCNSRLMGRVRVHQYQVPVSSIDSTNSRLILLLSGLPGIDSIDTSLMRIRNGGRKWRFIES